MPIARRSAEEYPGSTRGVHLCPPTVSAYSSTMTRGDAHAHYTPCTLEPTGVSRWTHRDRGRGNCRPAPRTGRCRAAAGDDDAQADTAFGHLYRPPIRTSGGICAKTYGLTQQENVREHHQPDVDF